MAHLHVHKTFWCIDRVSATVTRHDHTRDREAEVADAAAEGVPEKPDESSSAKHHDSINMQRFVFDL